MLDRFGRLGCDAEKRTVIRNYGLRNNQHDKSRIKLD